jgi:hypothetical protein
MAPELEDGRTEHVGSWNDIYSLGKLLFWLLSGGVVYSREKHRLQLQDVQEHWKHFLFDVLDQATAEDFSKRTQKVLDLRQSLLAFRSALERNGRYLSHGVPQPCDFCRMGLYRMLSGSASAHNYGVGGPSASLALVCDNCGNLQSFADGYWK